MQDFAVMDVLEREADLDEPVEDLLLIELLAGLLLLGDFAVHIASVCEVHDYAQTSAVHEAFAIGDNVRMAHGLEHVDFIQRFLFLFALHA